MPSNTIYLITGANRGLVKGLVKYYLSQPRNTVIAGVRDPEHSSAQALSQLPKDTSNTLILVKLESASEPDAAAAISYLESVHNITHLDVVIANAGISKVLPRVSEASISDLQEHYLVNVIGVVVIFKAVAPLLSKSKNPRFITMSSSAASLSEKEFRNFPNAAYGTSKAALNYITRKIHFENANNIAFPLDPGWVQTDMGNDGAKSLGLDSAEIPIEKSVQGMVKVIAGATKEKTSGQFMEYTGKVLQW